MVAVAAAAAASIDLPTYVHVEDKMSVTVNRGLNLLQGSGVSNLGVMLLETGAVAETWQEGRW